MTTRRGFLKTSGKASLFAAAGGSITVAQTVAADTSADANLLAKIAEWRSERDWYVGKGRLPGVATEPEWDRYIRWETMTWKLFKAEPRTPAGALALLIALAEVIREVRTDRPYVRYPDDGDLLVRCEPGLRQLSHHVV